MQASARFSSSLASKRVIAGISSSITRSCYRARRGKAHVAPLSAQEPPKGQKRVSKEERRIRIKEFVAKYGNSVGGSHYTVREILQELEYNNRMFPSKAAQLHETTELAEHPRLKNDVSDIYLTSQSFKEKQDTIDVDLSTRDAAISVENVDENEAPVSLELKVKLDPSHCHGKTEATQMDLYSAEVLQNNSDRMVSDQTESENVIQAQRFDSEHRPKHEHEESTKANLWGSLKSFADGISNFWKSL